ncbi:MAG: DUF1134 domain-containing protein [Hyphomicrobiales bacterium]
MHKSSKFPSCKLAQRATRKLITATWISVFLVFSFALVASNSLSVTSASAQNNTSTPLTETYSSNEILNTGHRFFGNVSGGLASVIERAFQNYGLPNAYILGEEGSGAIIGGLRYGEGIMYTKGAGDHKIFFQGPSIGWDFGGNASRVMMLVYNLPTVDHAYQRFGGVNGSAYVVGGVGMTVLANNNILMVPVRAGLGARLGVNVGYLKFTPRATWNPF